MFIKKCVKTIWRFPIRLFYKIKLKQKNFSIISSNCIGGGYYHDCFQKFLTPTINLTVENSISFFENINEYIQLDLLNFGLDQKGRPCGSLKDVIIHGVHYNTFEDLCKAWERRKKE